MMDAKTGSSWSQKARGGKESTENRQPEGFINGPLKNDICRDVGAFSDQIQSLTKSGRSYPHLGAS
jgi:hypothetical protein